MAHYGALHDLWPRIREVAAYPIRTVLYLVLQIHKAQTPLVHTAHSSSRPALRYAAYFFTLQYMWENQIIARHKPAQFFKIYINGPESNQCTMFS